MEGRTQHHEVVIDDRPQQWIILLHWRMIKLNYLKLLEQSLGRNNGGDLIRYDRDNPLLAIKQITTGFRKWAERYIAECHGQRKFNFQKKRMHKWFRSLGDKYIKMNPE